MAPNFTECGINFQRQYAAGNRTLAYNGTIKGVLSQGDRPALITVEGCLQLCGAGHEPYSSDVWTNTVTTWVLPVVGGLLLQAPFESNKFRRTFFALMRWLGSPIGSLSYVFWNIKVLGKCALMVDMAVEYSILPKETAEVSAPSTQPETRTTQQETGEVVESTTQPANLSNEPPLSMQSDFAGMRDSFYLLSVMNQFNIPPILPNMSAERLLRIALFSDTLQLTAGTPFSYLRKLREELAKELRGRRRRGAVPVFISVGWFLVSLAISINTAFGQLGGNATAHNLALGLMLGWLPVFVLACIVDRNPLSTNDVRKTLNQFLNVVKTALIYNNGQIFYVHDSSRLTDQSIEDHKKMIQDLEEYGEVFESFFGDFAGQGRTRWHYGVAHSMLAAVEDVGVAERGRGWFDSLPERHDTLVLGPEQHHGLHFFDWRECWQIIASAAIVFGTLLGAFVLSIYTPTVGLGCRSGGYLIYFLLTLFSFLLEMGVWWNITAQYKGREAIHVSATYIMAQIRRISTVQSVQPHLRRFNALLKPIQPHLYRFYELSLHSKLDWVIFKPMDIVNTGWLVYIVCSQTFGLYNTCECIGSTWGLGLHGGYVDFLSVVTYKAQGIVKYWLAGTVISIVILLVPSGYIFAEWLTQSHLCTEDYKSAMQGLRRTRRWKKRTAWLRALLRLLPRLAAKAGRAIRRLWYFVRPRKNRYVSPQSRSLKWSARPGPRFRRNMSVEQEMEPLTRPRTTSTSPMPPRHSTDSNDGAEYANEPIQAA